MTPQEMFDTAYLKIIQQGQKSTTASGSCRYRGPSGLKCAIGHMIPDDLAKSWDDRTNSSILQIRDTPKFPVPDYIKVNRTLASEIQWAHDHAEEYDHEVFVKSFKHSMAKLAKQYKLTIPHLENK